MSYLLLVYYNRQSRFVKQHWTEWVAHWPRTISDRVGTIYEFKSCVANAGLYQERA